MIAFPTLTLVGTPFESADIFVYEKASPDREHRTLVFRLVVKTRDARDPDGALAYVGSTEEATFPRGDEISSEFVVAFARRMLHAWVAHEADEWLHVDGVRVFDPHKSSDHDPR